MAYVICLPHHDRPGWDLPSAEINRETWTSGGVQSLCELAAALSELNMDVELRGSIPANVIEPWPQAVKETLLINRPPRKATATDTVIIPEGFHEPMSYASHAMSQARVILFMLAPPGLMGWPFLKNWLPTDIQQTDFDLNSFEKSIKAMSATGLTLLTNSFGIASLAEKAGVTCPCIGTGWPLPPKRNKNERTLEVSYLQSNRWASLASKASEKLLTQSTPIPESDHPTLLDTFSRTKLLLWPSCIEGWARIQCEARYMGAVPIGFRSNIFANGLTEANGAVLVDTPEEMGEEAQRLLSHPDLLEEKSILAMQSAEKQTDWKAYKERVQKTFLELSSPPPIHDVMSVFGAAIQGHTSDLLNEQAAYTVSTLQHAESRAQFTHRHPIKQFGMSLKAKATSIRSNKKNPSLFIAPWTGSLVEEDPFLQFLTKKGFHIFGHEPRKEAVDLFLGWQQINMQSALADTLPNGISLLTSVQRQPAKHYWNTSPAMLWNAKNMGESPIQGSSSRYLLTTLFNSTLTGSAESESLDTFLDPHADVFVEYPSNLTEQNPSKITDAASKIGLHAGALYWQIDHLNQFRLIDINPTYFGPPSLYEELALRLLEGTY